MRRRRTLLAGATLLGLSLGLASAVNADAPLVGVWVELRVSECLAATFEAPLRDTGRYIPGDKYRTAVVTGKVTNAGLQPYLANSHWVEKAAERAKSNLPARNAVLSLVLRRWDKSFCESAVGATRRFNYDYACDTLPQTGACLPPHQLAYSP
jgi:hypothetical protein